MLAGEGTIKATAGSIPLSRSTVLPEVGVLPLSLGSSRSGPSPDRPDDLRSAVARCTACFGRRQVVALDVELRRFPAPQAIEDG
jgi:hypothetical protein